MKVLLALAAMAMVGASTPRPQYAGMPPYRYMGDGITITVFTSKVEAFCGPPTPGFQIVGCYRRTNGRPVVVLPNPCLFPEEFFATIACHEKAHATHNWPADHPL